MTHTASSSASKSGTLEPNSLGVTFGLLGDEWTLLLLRVALSGATRYSDFRDRMPISHAVLSGRLERLVDEGLLERHIYQARPARSEYLLTPKGSSIWQLLLAIWTWERRWVTSHSYATPPIRHLTCGKEMSPIYCCRSCGEEACPENVSLSWGPAGGWARSTPGAQTRRRATRGGRTESSAFYPDTMTVFGNRWSAVIVAAAFAGVRRFRDFEAFLGPPPIVLSERLAALCDREILEQVQLTDRPDWSEYRLTRKGSDLFPVLAVVVDWSERWRSPADDAVLKRTHKTCGDEFRGVLVCDHCRATVRGHEVDLSGA
ncbi:helix-turn-helix transcriptional regulator [Leucobacter aridicollis]|nr:helix-turn-helix transcriptional regulator [Leucobacter aridicollis]